MEGIEISKKIIISTHSENISQFFREEEHQFKIKIWEAPTLQNGALLKNVRHQLKQKTWNILIYNKSMWIKIKSFSQIGTKICKLKIYVTVLYIIFHK